MKFVSFITLLILLYNFAFTQELADSIYTKYTQNCSYRNLDDSVVRFGVRKIEHFKKINISHKIAGDFDYRFKDSANTVLRYSLDAKNSILGNLVLSDVEYDLIGKIYWMPYSNLYYASIWLNDSLKGVTFWKAKNNYFKNVIVLDYKFCSEKELVVNRQMDLTAIPKEKIKAPKNETLNHSNSLGFSSTSRGNGSSTANNGRGFGSDDVKKARIRLNNPNTENISSTITCKVALKLSLDNEGNVVDASVVTSKTTTTDQKLLNKLIENVKSQVKYNKIEGKSGVENVFLTINILAKE